MKLVPWRWQVDGGLLAIDANLAIWRGDCALMACETGFYYLSTPRYLLLKCTAPSAGVTVGILIISAECIAWNLML